jgi:hypothetical protein
MTDTQRLSPGRLGEIVACLGFFRRDSPDEVARALGYDASIHAVVEREKSALAAAVKGGDVAPLRDFVRAHDVVLQRLEARRPKVVDLRRLTKLEPQRTRSADHDTTPAVEPRSHSSSDRPASPQRVPSYLQGASQAAPVAPPTAPPVVPEEVPTPGFVLSIGVPGAAPGPAHPSRRAGVATTGNIDPARVRAGLKLPFDGRAGEADPAATRAEVESSIEAFAMLTVALAGTEPREEVLKRFGLTEESRQGLAAQWGERIANDAQLRAAFGDLVRKHKGR